MKKGFTLIELLVVISIIGFLSSVVLASLTQAREKSKVAAALSQIRELTKATALYFNDTSTFPINCSIGLPPVCSSANDSFINASGVQGWSGPYISGVWNLFDAWGGRMGYATFDVNADGIPEQPAIILDDDKTSNDDNSGAIPLTSMGAIDDKLDNGNLNTGKVIGNGANLLDTNGALIVHTAVGEMIILLDF